ncbi:MAG: SMC-Scp complex subunit ScpB [Dehalococcoidia bacterium]|nr:SMC-Scp complex subunit ScpB [Dehalococcoidia bacterium]
MISTEKQEENYYPALIEAVLFVAEEPITISNLAKVLEINTSQVNKVLQNMSDDYNSEKRGINLQIGPDGVQFVTSPNTASIIEYFLGLEANRRLSTAALETLAIIAYRQPVTRHIIDTIRGVDSGASITTLRNRNLIEIKGRAPGPGRPALFVTTQRFLEHFGLTNPNELPTLPQTVENVLKETQSQGTLEFDEEETTANSEKESIEISSSISDLSEVVENFVTTQSEKNVDQTDMTTFY